MFVLGLFAISGFFCIPVEYMVGWLVCFCLFVVSFVCLGFFLCGFFGGGGVVFFTPGGICKEF